MKFIFFGTSGGVPTQDRNVTAIGLKRSLESWSLFDCGDGTTFQIARAKWDFRTLDSVFITHLHADHFFGILSLLFRKDLFRDDNLDLTVYAVKGVKEFIEMSLEITKKLFINFNLTIVEIEDGMELRHKDVSIDVIEMRHAITSYGFHLRVEGKRVIIGGDNEEPSIFGEYLRDVDLMVHEATFLDEAYVGISLKSMHTTAKLLGEVASNYQVKNLIATHISWKNQDQKGLRNIYDEINMNYKGEIFIADDFDEFELKEVLSRVES